MKQRDLEKETNFFRKLLQDFRIKLSAKGHPASSIVEIQ
jgi:hypothetical protein